MKDKKFNKTFDQLVAMGYFIEVEEGKYCLALKKGCLNCTRVQSSATIDATTCKFYPVPHSADFVCDNYEPDENYISIERSRS